MGSDRKKLWTALQDGLKSASMDPFAIRIAACESECLAEPKCRHAVVPVVHESNAIGRLELNQSIPTFIS
jgi:hypothetical protein